MRPDPAHYEYRVAWSPDDEAFVARVSELPSLSAHGETWAAALAELESVVRFVLEDLEANGEPIPEPFSTRVYSGRLNLRMPASLHRELSMAAEREGISLNQLILQRLAR